MPSWGDQTELHQKLRNITGLDPADDEHNPMNFVLPAYETMWRAVHRGLLEIYFREAPDAMHWKYLLLEFLHHPTRLAFHMENESLILSPRDVIKEILRLYPPTRRIYRRFENDAEDTKADLEKCHRNKLLATTKPESFISERWIDIR
jgi:hypothetical protein